MPASMSAITLSILATGLGKPATARVIDRQLTGRSISPHTIRHTTAMHLLQARVDITVIALWLGHESPATTQMYLEADLSMKERALSSLEQRRRGFAEVQPQGLEYPAQHMWPSDIESRRLCRIPPQVLDDPSVMLAIKSRHVRRDEQF